jgi:hypothetical protein
MKKFEKVPIGGIAAKDVLALWREGKLYQEVSEEDISDEELQARCRQEALRYVAAIDGFATEKWRPLISEVWERVLSDKMFSAMLVMRNKRQLNRYFLTSLVFNLQARGIYYPAGKVSQLRLHLTLEGTNKKNSIYKNIVNYPVRLEQRRRLTALMEDLLPSLR